MSKYEIESLIETMNNYDDLASKAKAKADAIRDTLKGEMLRLGAEELTAGAYIVASFREYSRLYTVCCWLPIPAAAPPTPSKTVPTAPLR